jgi:hypothetical protein
LADEVRHAADTAQHIEIASNLLGVTRTCYISHYRSPSRKKGFPKDAGKPFIFQKLLVGAVGIELKATLKARKLLISLNGKNAKNNTFAQVRYTAGTRRGGRWK